MFLHCNGKGISCCLKSCPLLKLFRRSSTEEQKIVLYSQRYLASWLLWSSWSECSIVGIITGKDEEKRNRECSDTTGCSGESAQSRECEHESIGKNYSN